MPFIKGRRLLGEAIMSCTKKEKNESTYFFKGIGGCQEALRKSFSFAESLIEASENADFVTESER